MPKKHDGFEIFESGSPRGEWYWRLHRRGRVIADGSESYTRRADAVRAVRGIATWLRGSAPVTVTVRPGRKR